MSTRHGKVGALLLSGGRSSRFGTDKSKAPVGGRLLLERVLDVATPLVDEVLVVGAWAPKGVPCTLEPTRFEGPLSGFAWGMSRIGTPHALVLGCDHPLLAPSLLGMLLSRRRSAAAVVPVAPYGPQPLVAVYHESLVPVAERLVEEGERRLRALVEGVDVDWVEEDDWRRVDPEGHSFLDVDWPEDAERIERLIADATQDSA